MTAQHTPGTPVASGNGIHIGMRCLATTHMEPWEQRVIDARRIAACWNACAEISTETLEERGPGTALAVIAARAIEQQGELLEALKAITEWAERFRASGDAGNWEWSEGDEYTNAIAAIARATHKEQT